MSHKNGSCKFGNENGNGSNLIRLHPREDSFQVSQGRSVLSTDITGFICPKTKDGFFVHQTRMLSEYRWLLDNVEPLAVALSNVEQHSWLGYYIQVSSSMKNRDRGSGELAKASEKSVELRLSRSVSYGLHEDVDLTNFTQKSIKLKLQLKVAADFADQEETATNRKQFGKVNCKWGKNGKGNWELAFDYVSHHHYLHQEDEGDVCLHRSLAIEIAHCNSAPTYSRGTISFSVSLQPLQSWHTCVRFSPIVDDEPSFPLYKCYAFRSSDHPFDTTRGEFISNTAQFRNPASSLLSETVLRALERAKYDLAALRLHDLDQGEGAWVPAAGIPIYIALFGRDTLTVAWQVAAVTSEIMLGTLPVIANLQGQVVDNWRDEQPGRMLHESAYGSAREARIQSSRPLLRLGYHIGFLPCRAR